MAVSEIEALRQLWRRGDIADLIFHDGQLKLHDVFLKAEGQLIVFLVSRQFGKTILAATEAVIQAIKFPGSRIRIGAAFEADLTEFIEPAFDMVLGSCPDDMKPRYVGHKKRFIFPNGSTIKLVGLDLKPNGLRGNTVDLIIIDEAGFAKRLEYLYSSVIIPLKTHRPTARVLFMSTPPESPDHEFWGFVDHAKLSGHYAEFTIDDNPMLTPERVKEIENDLGGRNTTAFQREYLCKRIVEQERAIVPEWKESMGQIFQRDELYKFWHKYEALDIGVQVDKTVVLFAYYNFREGRIYVEDELDISGSTTTTDLIEKRLIEKQDSIPGKPYNIPYRRIADNSHPLLLNDLASRPANLVFGATDKAKIHEMVGEVRVWTRMDRLRVHPRCKQLIGCLSSGIWNNQRTEFERSKVFGHYDALAALVYLIRNIDQYTNPIPDYVGNPNRWPGFNKKEVLSPLGQDMKAIFSKRK